MAHGEEWMMEVGKMLVFLLVKVKKLSKSKLGGKMLKGKEIVS